MTKSEFTSILKERMAENALAYLVGKQGEKGKEIKYMSLEMSEYLQPINQNLTIEEKCEMFSIRNQMIQIPYNFPGKNKENKCLCEKNEDMVHIFNCETYKKKETELKYEHIFDGNLKQQIEVFEIFNGNLKQRETFLNEMEPPCDLNEIRCFSVLDNK